MEIEIQTETQNQTQTRDPVENIAFGIFGVIVFIWLLATVYCTPAGRWIRRKHPRAQHHFYLDVGYENVPLVERHLEV